MSEQDNYYTVQYHDKYLTPLQVTVVKGPDKESAVEKFKRDNPHVQVVAIGTNQ